MKRRDFLGMTTALLGAPLLIKLTACSDDGGGGGTTTSGGTTTTGGGGGGNPAFRISNSDTSHPHSFVIVCADVDKETVTYTAGGSGHTHPVTLSGDQIADILDGQTVTVETTDLHPHTWTITMPSDGCEGPAEAPTDESTSGGGW